MVKRLRQRLGNRGAVAVEFALVLPLLLLLVLGGIDWGYFFFVGQIAANAAREGARTAALIPGTGDPCPDSTTPPMSGAISVAKNYMVRGGLIADGSDGRLQAFDTTCPGTMGHGCCQFLNPDPALGYPTVRVTVVFQARPGTMSLTGFLPASLLPTAVVATATMRREP